MQEIAAQDTEEIIYQQPAWTILKIVHFKGDKFVLIDTIVGEKLKTWYTYAYEIEGFGVNDLEIIGFKAVNFEKSKLAMIDNDKFLKSKSQLKTVLPHPVEDHKDRKLTCLHSNSAIE